MRGTYKTRYLAIITLTVASVLLTACAAGIRSAAPPGTDRRPTPEAETMPAPRTGPTPDMTAPLSFHFETTTTQSAYTSRGTIDARTCDGVTGRWTGNVRIEQPYIEGDATLPVAWTFDRSGRAVVTAGPFHENMGGDKTASFVTKMHLEGADGPSPAIVVDDLIQVQPGFPNLSLASRSTNLGTPVRIVPVSAGSCN